MYVFPLCKPILIVLQVAIDAANPTDMTVLVRMFITTSAGTVQLWQHEKLQWTREESLSTIAIAQFVELPERVITHRNEDDESFAGRLARQLSDAQVRIALTSSHTHS